MSSCASLSSVARRLIVSVVASTFPSVFYPRTVLSEGSVSPEKGQNTEAYPTTTPHAEREDLSIGTLNGRLPILDG